MKAGKLFRRFLRFLALLGLLGGLYLMPIPAVQAQQALHWRLSLPISAYNSLETQLEDLPGRRWQQDRAAQNAILEGSGIQADLRSLLFDELAPLSLISQPTRIQIQIPAQSQQELVLEALPSNGAYWYFTGPSQILVQELGSPEYRSPGKGVPALQRFLLNNPTVYEQNAVFDYKRIFDQDWQPMLYLDLGGLGKDQVLELSDPSYRALIPALFPAVPQVKAPESSRATPVLPAYYDARQYGLVTPVKNQGYCGSCWAFGTVGVMETALARSGYGLRDLSEQFLISCNQDNWGCGGGLTAHPYHFDKKDKLGQGPGAVFELDAPYLGVNSACTSLPRAFRLADWEYVAGGRDPELEGSLPSEQLIKEAIYQYGAVTAGVCAGQEFSNYSGGVYSADECDYNRYPVTNHQIILVGWNDANQTWLLKNSYGTSWGLQGYMWIHRNAGMVGEGASWVFMAPHAPVAYSPAGNVIATRRIAFSWIDTSSAESFHLVITHEGEEKTTLTVERTAVCNPAGYCQAYISTGPLDSNTYTWNVTPIRNGEEQLSSNTLEFSLTKLDSYEMFLPLVSK